MHFFTRSISALTFITLLNGCLYPDASDWKQCRFEISSLQFKGSLEDQTEWEITVNVHNPGSNHLKMERVKLFAMQGADTLATLRNVAPLDLPPHDSSKVTLTTSLPQKTWDTVLESLRREGKIKVTIAGEAYYRGPFGVQKLPGLFHKTYELDLATALNAMGSHLLEGLQGLPFKF